MRGQSPPRPGSGWPARRGPRWPPSTNGRPTPARAATRARWASWARPAAPTARAALALAPPAAGARVVGPPCREAAERALTLAEPDRLILPFAMTGAGPLLETVPP